VVVLFVAALVLVAFSIGRVSLQASTDPNTHQGDPTTYATVVVGPGDTLWDIARQAAPGVDPRVTVARIVELNALDGSVIRQGQELLLP
jgi:LysM repeat protein